MITFLCCIVITSGEISVKVTLIVFKKMNFDVDSTGKVYAVRHLLRMHPEAIASTTTTSRQLYGLQNLEWFSYIHIPVPA